MPLDYPDDDGKQSAQIIGETPGLRLVGTETDGEDLTLRENAGQIELYDETAGSVAATWDLNPQLESESIVALDASITELRGGTSGNRPAAGTSGRIFFERDTRRVLYDDGASWLELGAVWDSGSTRPSSPIQGQRFFDTGLGQPIWYDGTDWVDAQGNVV